MPPKKGPSKKAENSAKKKVIEDKTFGLKNKNKSAKVGRYVQQVERQVMSSGNPKSRKAEDDRMALAQKKQEEKKKQEEFAEMFKPVAVQQKVPFGVDPKTIVCEFFKVGACKKGDKCKFSHNMAVDRKGSKMDVYTDKRDQEEDTMDKWDQSRLEEVVVSKHGNPQTTTNIVCKHFLEAIESGKYGWFWECPNSGDKCKYKHALPPGFVLKKDKKPKEVDEISLEEFLETERHKLGANLTPVTLESFTKWKIERKARKEQEENEARVAKERAFKAGKMANMSGRDYFEFNPELQGAGADDGDDDDAFDFAQYRNTEGGYQQDSEYADAPQNEDLSVGEDLEALKIDDKGNA
ncbi:Translation machinery-associated protein 46 [Coemansia interrupta]|uniref:Translation machinery-associated protein 46 n=1 Tax=Coemansia interrupta TaxID=1126814 RepID=A0A9W8HQF0_9FUNG|nr:Translation machinery-associated protein 46 [Coemansia interrupta]